MSDGYVVLRKSTLAYLLECARRGGGLENVPEEVARDLGLAVVDVDAPVPDGRLDAVGPILSIEEHELLLAEDPDLDLPRDRQAGAFWRLVTRVAWTMLRNEADAVRRVIAERESHE